VGHSEQLPNSCSRRNNYPEPTAIAHNLLMVCVAIAQHRTSCYKVSGTFDMVVNL
jgi:hypothetical protein